MTMNKSMIIYTSMLILLASLVLAAAPTMTDVTINVIGNTSVGSCNAADTDGDNVSFQYEWYLNGSIVDEDYAFNGLYNITIVDPADTESTYVTSGDWFGVTGPNIIDEDFGTCGYCYTCVAGANEWWNLSTYQDVHSVTFYARVGNNGGTSNYVQFSCLNESAAYDSIFFWQGGGTPYQTVEIPRTCLQESMVKMQDEIKGGGTWTVAYYEGRMNFNKATGYAPSTEANIDNYTTPLTPGTEVKLRCRALGTITETSSWDETTYIVPAVVVPSEDTTSAARRGDYKICNPETGECYLPDDPALLSITGQKGSNPFSRLIAWFKNLGWNGDAI